MDTLEEARAALRARQGAGARYDAPTAPAAALRWARLGTAFFARLLNDLPDAALLAASAVPGWTRAHVVARIGYQARALARLAAGAASGAAQSLDAPDEARRAEIDDGASLPAQALRHLYRHAAVHLDVEWRDLSAAAWDAAVMVPGPRTIAVRDTAWIRARALWLASVDLDAGGSLLDAPADLIDRLVAEAAAAWPGPGRSLVPSDRGVAIALAGGGPPVGGRAADLARWVTGRGAGRLSHREPLPDVVVDPKSEL